MTHDRDREGLARGRSIRASKSCAACKRCIALGSIIVRCATYQSQRTGSEWDGAQGMYSMLELVDWQSASRLPVGLHV